MEQVDLIPIWKALADTKRRRIIQLLQNRAHTTSEISAHFDVSRFAIMQHLKVLEQARLIKTRREGRQRWSSLNEDLFRQIQEACLERNPDREYQLEDILTFLTRQEGAQLNETFDPGRSAIQLEVALQTPAGRVYRAFTHYIDSWWAYRIGTESQIRLEPQIGGRFFEEFKDGGGALYAFVTYLQKDKEIRLNGSMGLGDDAANDTIHIVLQSPQEDRTLLILSHHFQGRFYLISVDNYRNSWLELLTRHLKPFVESGKHFPRPGRD